MPTPVIPSSWTENDRRIYLKIAKRKKDEHVSAYTTVAIGCQMFYGLALNIHKQPEPPSLGKDDGDEGDAAR